MLAAMRACSRPGGGAGARAGAEAQADARAGLWQWGTRRGEASRGATPPPPWLPRPVACTARARRPTRAGGSTTTAVLPSPHGERHRRRVVGPRLETTHCDSPSRPKLTTPTAPWRHPEHAAPLGHSPRWLEVIAPRRRPWPRLGNAAAMRSDPPRHSPGQQMAQTDPWVPMGAYGLRN